MTAENPGSAEADRIKGESEKSPGQGHSDPPNEHDRSLAEDHDVALDVPLLNVEEISLEVEELRAHISARAELVDFLSIGVGVDVYLNSVKLEVKGVEAQLQLKVRLERILGTIDRALDVMANDPQRSRGPTGDPSLTEGQAGDTGDVPEDAQTGFDGDAVGGAVPGDLSDLTIEDEYVDDEGNIVGVARDAHGNLVEGELDDEGNVVGAGSGGEKRRPTQEAEEFGEEGVKATDAARSRALDLGVDLSGVKGTGSGERILVKDVERAARAR